VKFRDTLVIARRELLERVRSRWFVAMTLLGPIGLVALIVIPALASTGTSGTRIDIIDQSSYQLAEPVAVAFRAREWRTNILPPTTPDAQLYERIRTKQTNGFIKISPTALDGGPIIYRGDNGSSQLAQIEVRMISRAVVQAARGARAGLSASQLAEVLQEPTIDIQHSTGTTEGTSGLATFLVGYILGFLLYFVITLYGVGIMRSVVQEKTSRVMELMVAVVKPRALMGGKILGVGGAGLIQIVVWLGIGALALAYRDTIAGWFGATGAGPALPPLAAAEIAIILVYFVLGFFFYAAVYAAVGAMVSSEQDTQQLQLPVTLVMMVGLLCLQLVTNDPRGSSAQLMTTIPLWSPMLMPMRYVLGGADTGDVALSLAILLVSTLLVVRAAAKIYRVGVLLYGKRPGLAELVRWLRY
jgi:ABC-2 type transport system permease protein